jgi:hypothetical protein
VSRWEIVWEWDRRPRPEWIAADAPPEQVEPYVRAHERVDAVALTQADAAAAEARSRLAANRRGEPPSRIVVREVAGAELVHRDVAGWAYWSDGAVTDAPRGAGYDLFSGTGPRGLTAAAAGLIREVRGADGGRAACGYALLARVERIAARRVVAGDEHGAGQYQAPRIEQLTCELVDGDTVVLFEFSEGYSEGYACEISDAIANAWVERCPPPAPRVDPRFLALYARVRAASDEANRAASVAPDLLRERSPAEADALDSLHAYADARGLCRLCGRAAHDRALFCEPPHV